MRARLLVLGAFAGPLILCSAAVAKTITGRESPDRITGTDQADVIHGQGGGDRAGDDIVTAVITRSGARVKCGPGDDVVTVSRLRGNRRRVRVAADRESVHRG